MPCEASDPYSDPIKPYNITCGPAQCVLYKDPSCGAKSPREGGHWRLLLWFRCGRKSQVQAELGSVKEVLQRRAAGSADEGENQQ